MTANLERFIDNLAVELKQESPEAVAMSDFALRSLILDKIKDHAEAEADTLVAIKTITEIVRALKVLD